jgi:peptidylprolyl isomerase
MVLGTAACSSTSDTSSGSASGTPSVDRGQAIPGLTVSGKFGAEPNVKIKAPLKADQPQTHVVSVGHGNPVVEGQKALLHIYLANGTTGQKAATTYDQGAPADLTISQQSLFPPVVKALVGKPQGSRVEIASSVRNVYGSQGAPQLHLKPSDSLVFVVDIMSVQPKDVLKGPQGAPQKPPAGLPTVVQQGTKVTNLDFSKAAKKPPNKLQVIPLTKGSGPVARDDSLVTFNYFGEEWGAKQPFDESYSKQPVTFALGIGSLIKGWDQGLVGLHRGTRVMIIAPPKYAYGATGNPQGGISKNATLVFIVDILGVDG